MLMDDSRLIFFNGFLDRLYDFMHEKLGFGDTRKQTCTDPTVGIKLYLSTKPKIMNTFGKVYFQFQFTNNFESSILDLNKGEMNCLLGLHNSD